MRAMGRLDFGFSRSAGQFSPEDRRNTLITGEAADTRLAFMNAESTLLSAAGMAAEWLQWLVSGPPRCLRRHQATDVLVFGAIRQL